MDVHLTVIPKVKKSMPTLTIHEMAIVIRPYTR